MSFTRQEDVSPGRGAPSTWGNEQIANDQYLKGRVAIEAPAYGMLPGNSLEGGDGPDVNPYSSASWLSAIVAEYQPNVSLSSQYFTGIAPPDFVGASGFDIDVVWTVGAAAANQSVRVATSIAAVGTKYDATSNAEQFTTASFPTTGQLNYYETTLTAPSAPGLFHMDRLSIAAGDLDVEPHDIVAIRFARLGQHADDTLTSTMNVLVFSWELG